MCHVFVACFSLRRYLRPRTIRHAARALPVDLVGSGAIEEGVVVLHRMQTRHTWDRLSATQSESAEAGIARFHRYRVSRPPHKFPPKKNGPFFFSQAALMLAVRLSERLLFDDPKRRQSPIGTACRSPSSIRLSPTTFGEITARAAFLHDGVVIHRLQRGGGHRRACLVERSSGAGGRSLRRRGAAMPAIDLDMLKRFTGRHRYRDNRDRVA